MFTQPVAGKMHRYQKITDLFIFVPGGASGCCSPQLPDQQEEILEHEGNLSADRKSVV